MERALAGSKRFRLLVATFGHAQDRAALIEHIEREHETSGSMITIDPSCDARWLEAEIAAKAQHASRVHVTGFERLGNQRDEWLLRLNYAREGIAADSPAALIFWMFDEDATALAEVAPDLWAWRSGVFEFVPPRQSTARPALAGFVWSDTHQKQQRLAKIERYLATPLVPPSEPRALMHAEAAAILLDLFRNAEAMMHIEEARTIFRTLGEEHQVARVSGLEGRALLRLGQIQRAESCLREALRTLERHQDSHGQIVALGDLARVRSEQGEVDDALGLLHRAAEIASELGDARSQVLVEQRLADLYLAKGDIDEAVARLESVVQSTRAVDVSALRATTLRNLGRLESRRGRHTEALDLLQKALRIFDELGDRRGYDLTQGDIANVLVLRGEYEEALALCQVLIEGYRSRGDERSMSHALWLKGRILTAQGRFESALEAYEHAYRISVDIGNAEGVAMIGRDYGRLLIDSDSLEEARVVLAQSHDAFSRIGNVARATKIEALLDSIPGSDESSP